jgi:acetyltransferase-like isoleucine patch superfamily enzyme
MARRSFNVRALFGTYSYVENFGWALCNLLPPFVRSGIFRLIFKRMGRKCLIDYGTYFRYPSKISIGDHCVINRGCKFFASYLVAGTEIILGNHVILGPDVRLFSAGHDYTRLDLPDTAETIRIHDHVWIGGGAVILQGVEIGEGTIVGAGSVVTRSLPPWSVAVGNPARVIRARTLCCEAK